MDRKPLHIYLPLGTTAERDEAIEALTGFERLRDVVWLCLRNYGKGAERQKIWTDAVVISDDPALIEEVRSDHVAGNEFTVVATIADLRTLVDEEFHSVPLRERLEGMPRSEVMRYAGNQVRAGLIETRQWAKMSKEDLIDALVAEDALAAWEASDGSPSDPTPAPSG